MKAGRRQSGRLCWWAAKYRLAWVWTMVFSGRLNRWPPGAAKPCLTWSGSCTPVRWPAETPAMSGHRHLPGGRRLVCSFCAMAAGSGFALGAEFR